MCSIFVAITKNNKRVDHQACISALHTTKSRGPDNTYYTSNGSVFIGVNVLSLTGSTSVKDYTCDKGILGFNGEIYNYNKQQYDSDTQALFLKLISSNDKCKVTREIEGMFCYAFYDKTSHDLYLARDVFGERTLYIYENEDLLLASSTLHGIEKYIGKLHIAEDLISSYFYTRHFLTYNSTVYKNVRQILPGTIEVYNVRNYSKRVYTYESIADYICSKQMQEYARANDEEMVEELDSTLDHVMKQMLPLHHSSVSFSGGIDSSLIAHYTAKHTNDYTLIGINCVGKDYISNDLKKFQPYFNNQIITLDIKEKQWCSTVKDSYNITLQPLGSHNYCTKVFLAKYLQKKGIKVLFGGEGADELFGGYDFYHIIDDTCRYNISPYSSKLTSVIDFAHKISENPQSYLDKIWEKAYSIYNSAVLSTSFTDTSLVVNDDGVRNTDQIAGWYGIEGRTPFLHKKMLKFALNLPSKYKRGKPLLRKLFEKKFPTVSIEKKQGFAGFPNESQKYYALDNTFTLFNINDLTKYDTATQWKLLNIYYFYESYNSRNISRASRARAW